MPSDYGSSDREAGATFADRAETALGNTDAPQHSAMTYALLAIYYELRHNNQGAKIDALASQVRKAAALQEQRFEVESGLVQSVRELKDEVTAIKHAPRGE